MTFEEILQQKLVGKNIFLPIIESKYEDEPDNCIRISGQIEQRYSFYDEWYKTAIKNDQGKHLLKRRNKKKYKIVSLFYQNRHIEISVINGPEFKFKMHETII